MTWLVEDPTPILVAVLLVEAVLTFVLVKTGRGLFLYWIAGVAVLGAVLLAVEWLVVTDREEIEVTLDGAARALAANDPQGVLFFVDPTAAMRDRVPQEMARVEIRSAGYRQLEVKVNRRTSPPTAQAEFTAMLRLKDLHGEFPYEAFVHPFTVTFRKQGDRWLMTGYDDQNLRGGR